LVIVSMARVMSDWPAVEHRQREIDKERRPPDHHPNEG
jgi:hypothetical protein